jgi:hypothetical protein
LRQDLDPLATGVDPTTDNPWVPTRGGSQGDPLSTLGWVVFFDILLTALNEVQREFSFYVRHNGSTLILKLPLCYADDLHSVSSCREATVKANCIISAFAAMFGIEFAPAKLRAVSSRTNSGEVVLYTHDWVLIVAPSTLILQLPLCYADDLYSVSSCREATVKANCIILAFAAMFGIEFASAKLRAVSYRTNPGDVVLYT